jgi:hypothetical protein
VYISANREDILKGTALVNKISDARSSSTTSSGASAAAAAAAAPTSAATAAAIRKDPQLKALKAYLQKVAPSKEVLIGVSNMNPLREGMLGTFLEGVKQAKVDNYVIVALDEETTQEMQKQNINVFHMPIEISQSQKDTGSNHAVSALKFGIIKKFLMVGWAVLLSDIDICVLQDPFKHLYRSVAGVCKLGGAHASCPHAWNVSCHRYACPSSAVALQLATHASLVAVHAFAHPPPPERSRFLLMHAWLCPLLCVAQGLGCGRHERWL